MRKRDARRSRAAAQFGAPRAPRVSPRWAAALWTNCGEVDWLNVAPGAVPAHLLPRRHERRY